MKYRVNRDKADDAFSKYIRLRDRECRRCHSFVQFNAPANIKKPTGW